MTYANAYGAVQHYASVSNTTAVTDADPHRLVGLLLAGALDRISIAKGCMGRGEVAGKGENIGRAIGILEGLRGSLDLEAGGELARNLDDLYDYLTRRLLEANVRNDVAPLDEVSGLLGDVKNAWDAIAGEARTLHAARNAPSNEAPAIG